MNRAKRKYMKLLKDYFPYGRACQKKFLVSIAEDIDHFVQEHDPCTYDMLVDEFGKPQEVILNYQKEIEISDIRNVRKAMTKHVGLAIGVCGILFGTVISATPWLRTERKDTAEDKVADIEEEDFDEGYSDLERELLSHSGNYYDDYGNVVLKVIEPVSGDGGFSAYILDTGFQTN